MSALERSPQQIQDIQEIGRFLVKEQGSQIVKKLRAQGVFPGETTVNVELVFLNEHLYMHPDFVFNRQCNELTRGETPYHLPPTHANIFNILCMNEGKMVSRRKIVKEVWGLVGDSSLEGSLRVNIFYLRKKFKEAGINPNLIRTHRSLGYSLHRPTEEEIAERKNV